jgi:hypothetical protein
MELLDFMTEEEIDLMYPTTMTTAAAAMAAVSQKTAAAMSTHGSGNISSNNSNGKSCDNCLGKKKRVKYFYINRMRTLVKILYPLTSPSPHFLYLQSTAIGDLSLQTLLYPLHAEKQH